MAIATALCSSFKKELFEGVHNFKLSGGDTFKLALFSSVATLNAATTAYAVTNESSGTGYSAGGAALTRIDPALDGTTAIIDFADLVFSAVTVTARGCLIYNSSKSNKAVSVHDFGADKVATAGDFTILMPAADAAHAIIRIGSAP